jgi:hypothetical protein
MKYLFLSSLLCCLWHATIGQTITLEFSKATQLSFADGLKADSLSLPKGTLLTPPTAQLRTLLTTPAEIVGVALPFGEAQVLHLDLVETNSVLADDFVVRTSDGRTLPRPTLRFYRGKVAGDAASWVSLTLAEEGLEGMIHTPKGSYTLGKLQNRTDGTHILYRNADVVEPAPRPLCTTIELPKPPHSGGRGTAQAAGGACRYVRVYYECDYATYQAWGNNATSVTNRVSTLFSQVSTLYANENVEIRLSNLYLWTAADPYANAGNSSAALDAFRGRWNGLNNSFDGNVAHLLSTRGLGGGVAYYYDGNTINAVRAIFAYGYKDYAFGVNGSLQNNAVSYPTYSWNVGVMAHELGHNFGLPHTHSCLWQGGAIDNCYGVEGSCSPGPAPTNGGTVMSYCHLNSNGINFANGFGTLPRNKMQAEVTNAASLSVNAPTPPTVSSATVTAGQSATLTASGCPGGTINWYTSISGSVPTATGSTYTTPSLTMNASYFATCTIGGCTSSSRGAGTVTIGCASATATLGSNATITTGQTATLTITLVGGSPRSLTLSNGQSFSNIATSPLALTVAPLTTTTYTITRLTTDCGTGTYSGSATVTVNCPSMYTLRTGNWTDATVWSCQRVPTASDPVLISSTHVITLPAAAISTAQTIHKQGRLIFLMGSRLRVGQ